MRKMIDEMSFAELCARAPVGNYNTFNSRRQRGWSFNDAMNIPATERRRKPEKLCLKCREPYFAKGLCKAHYRKLWWENRKS